MSRWQFPLIVALLGVCLHAADKPPDDPASRFAAAFSAWEQVRIEESPGPLVALPEPFKRSYNQWINEQAGALNSGHAIDYNLMLGWVTVRIEWDTVSARLDAEEMASEERKRWRELKKRWNDLRKFVNRCYMLKE
jgi:hypothetical protein